MTTRKRHSPEQVVHNPATRDRMLGDGVDVADVRREQISRGYLLNNIGALRHAVAF